MSKEILSGRETASKSVPEIDSLYVYQTSVKAKFSHRQQPGIGYRYTNHKALMRGGEDEIHIYHCTAKIDDVMQGLTMVTKDKRVTVVKRFFVEAIREIKANEGLLTKFKQAKETPQELGILYQY